MTRIYFVKTLIKTDFLILLKKIRLNPRLRFSESVSSVFNFKLVNKQ